MKRNVIFFMLLLFATSLSARNQRDTLGVGPTIRFSENKGQWEDCIRFKAQMHAAALFLEQNCFTIVLQHPENANLKHHPSPADDNRYRQHAYKVRFVGAQTKALLGGDKQEDYENYFIGKDPAHWAGGVGVYHYVEYQSLYPGVNMKVYSAENAMKYDFIVAPHADADAIVMQYEGIDGARLQDGNILIHTSVLDVVELRPYAYQMVDGVQREVPVEYLLKGNEVHFKIGDYDHDKELVIDPYLYFSTYTGSTADNWGTTAAYDYNKNTYTAGVVFAIGYPVSTGAYDGTYNGNADVGIFVFNPTGSQRIYATYLGGNRGDMPHSMYVNDMAELVIFGTTGSNNFPVTPNAYDTSFNGGYAIAYESTAINYPNGSDIFVCRFNSSGTQLLASTYIGGSNNDGLNYEDYYNTPISRQMLGNDSLYFNYGDGARGELITDNLANVYVGTTTKSGDFPVTANSFRPSFSGGQDGVVFKLDYNLSHLLWSSYLGGTGDDAIYSIDVDDQYNLLVCGGTNSTNFPTTHGSYDTTYNGGSADGFLAKISYYGTSLMASTLFGSSTYDQCYFVRAGKDNDVFTFGQTKAAGSTLIHNANYNVPNSGQFLARFTPNLDSLRWSTVMGTGSGEPNLSPTAFAADICNRVYAAGWGRKFAGYAIGPNNTTIPWNTYGTWGMPVTSNAYQNTTDGQDFYVFSINADASALVYATFFGEQHTSEGGGNDHVDGGTSRFDRSATLYQSVCASCGGYESFPTTTGAWSATNNSYNCNNAIFRLNVGSDFPVADFAYPPSECFPHNYQFTFNGRADSVLWDFGDGTTSHGSNAQHDATHTYSQPGVYTVRLVAYMDTGCRATDTVEHQVLLLGNSSYWLDTMSTCINAPVQIGMPPVANATYRWIQGVVSDTNISNPYVNQTGIYTLLVSSRTDSNCVDTVRQVVIMRNTNFSIIADTVSCSSPMTLTANCPGTNVNYHWSHYADFHDNINTDANQSFITVDISSSTTFYIRVTDDLGCEKVDSIHVRFYAVMDTLLTTPATCPNGCDGTVIALATGLAVHPITYSCDGVTSYDSLVQNLCAGPHTFVFTDNNGCQITKNFQITAPPAPIITANVTHILCLEENTGAIALTVQGAGSYTFEWLDDGSTSPNRTGLAAGTYIVKITDNLGCQFYDTVNVLDNADMAVNVTFEANTCIDHCSGRATALVSGGTAPYSYLWDNGETTASASELCSGTSSVQVTDVNGCVVSGTVTVGTQHSFDSIDVWADDSVVFINESTALHATAIPNGTYQWQPVSLLSGSTTANPTTSLLTDTTTFVVTYTDSVGCTYTDSVKVCCIQVDCGRSNVFIPNIFTPNGDGLNDEWCFRGEYIIGFHIVVFTRWGELVFETDDVNKCWNGRYKDNWCQPGVYTYYCTVECEGHMSGTFKGDVTLIR